MRQVLVGLLLLCGVGAGFAGDPSVLTVHGEPSDQPWWRRAHWQPRATAVQGVPIRRLHPDWCAAESLSRERLDATVGPASVESAVAGRSFLLEGPFDGSAARQIAFVGVYRRCSGEQGLFVAIVEPAKERPRMRFLVEVPEPGSAIALLDREPDGTLAVWWCADCGQGNRIAFNRDKREFYVAGPATRR